jgi:N-acetyl-anhydromuramyl-L-alanine amidase AmpD
MVDMLRDPKTINKIIIHCSDSDEPEHDNIETIREWHIGRKKWSDVGYHYFIDKKGRIFTGRPHEKVGAHCIGQNAKSIGICVSGRKDFWEPQFRSLAFIVKDLMRTYNISRNEIYPHNFFNIAKTCPNFNIDKIWVFDSEKNKC